MKSRDLDSDYQQLEKAVAAERQMGEQFTSERYSIQLRINKRLADNLSAVFSNSGWNLTSLNNSNNSTYFGCAYAVKNSVYGVEVNFMPMPNREYWADFYLAYPPTNRNYRVGATLAFPVEKLPVALEKGESLLLSKSEKLTSRKLKNWLTRKITLFDLNSGRFEIVRLH